MSLLFKSEHLEQIKNGEKTETRRDWAEGYHPPKVGSIQMAVDEMFMPEEECDCFIVVTDVRTETLAELTPAAASAEGGYTVPEFRDVWRAINGEWDPDLEVHVVEFVYAGESRTEAKTRFAEVQADARHEPTGRSP